MRLRKLGTLTLAAALAAAAAATGARAADEAVSQDVVEANGVVDAPEGFKCYGYAAVAPQSRGIFATVDAEKRPIVMIWPMAADGTNFLLVVNAITGETEQIAVPKSAGTPYTSILAKNGKFYSQFGDRFYEFDPATHKFTFDGAVGDDLAMWMTEDDQGRIWTGIYPNAHLVSFDPKTRELNDYGPLNKENWPQYPRLITSDDAGWIYTSIGSTRGHVIAFDPKTKEMKPMIETAERVPGQPEIFRSTNGKVYMNAGAKAGWFELHGGTRTAIKEPPKVRVNEKVSSQGAFFGDLPGGMKITSVSLPDKEVRVKSAEGVEKTLNIDYKLPGTHILSLTSAPDGKSVIGSTGLPLRIFRLDATLEGPMPHDGTDVGAHMNAWAEQGGKLFGGTYANGGLNKYDPTQPVSENNPVRLMQAPPNIIRPHALLALSDGHRLIMGGTPAYGATGGGLLLWDDAAGTGTILSHKQLLENLATKALENLPDGLVLGGTSTDAGTGGERLATIAELYIFDPDTKKIVWHEPALKGVAEYRDLKMGKDGLVYGMADRGSTPVFFVFDPAARKVVHESEVSGMGRNAGAQAPRIMATGEDGTIYVLFTEAIGKITPGKFAVEKVVDLPTHAHTGFVMQGGRLWFADANRVWSYELKE